MRISSFFNFLSAWFQRLSEIFSPTINGIPQSGQVPLADSREIKKADLQQNWRGLPYGLFLQIEAFKNFTSIGFWATALETNGEIKPESEVFYSPSCLLLIGEKLTDSKTSYAFWKSHIHPEDLTVMNEKYSLFLEGLGTPGEFVIELRFRHKDGSWHWICLTAAIFSADNALYLNGTAQDVTKAHQLQHELKKQMVFQSELLEILPNPVFIKDENACFITFNRAYERAFGMKREDFIGKSVMDLDYLPLKDRKVYHHEDLELIRTGKKVKREIDFNFADGKKHHCIYWSNGLCNEEKGVMGLMGLIADISEKQETEKALAQKIEALNEVNAEIERISRIDHLTGLSNRRELMEHLQQTISNVAGGTFSVIMADLDDFKSINDTYGHATGDYVLQRFAEAIRKVCPKNCSAARLGGEEFLILLPMTTKDEALIIAEKIQNSIRCDKQNPCFTVSMGVVDYNTLQPEDASQLLHRADLAMYRAKSAGKNCCVSV